MVMTVPVRLSFGNRLCTARTKGVCRQSGVWAVRRAGEIFPADKKEITGGILNGKKEKEKDNGKVAVHVFIHFAGYGLVLCVFYLSHYNRYYV